MMNMFYKLKFLLLLLLVSHFAVAQTTVTGKVTELSTGDPLVGVSVLIKGTTIGTITDVNGEYKLAISQSNATLVFSYIGYLAFEVKVAAGQNKYDVKLEEDATQLEEIVISGLASTTKRANLANSIASVSALQISGITTQQTLDGALYGKFKGANIVASSGAPGGGVAIKLRGITSITGSSQPLYIIDGVYIDNSAIAANLNVVSAAAAGGSASNQDNPSNRIADITPEDIDKIEILKGASAASIYGSRSASGVVVITTKRGKEGKPLLRFSQSIGTAKMLNPQGQRGWTAQSAFDKFADPDKDENDPTNPGNIQKDLFLAAQAAGKVYDYEDELYGESGKLSNTSLSLSGGNKTTSYYTSIVRKSEDGIVKNTGYDKTSLRLNFSTKITDKIDLSVTSNYVSSSSDRGFFNNDNSGTTMGISFLSTVPWAELHADANGNYPNNNYAPSNFLQTRDLITNNEDVKRFIGGATLNATLFQSEKSILKFTGTVGIDRYTLVTKAIFPKELQFQKDGNGLSGVSVLGTSTVNNRNLQAFLVHSFNPSSSLSFTSQLGLLSLEFDRNTVLTTATDLIGTQTNVDQAASTNASQTRQPEEDAGFYFQEEVNWEDKIIATVGVRADKSSNNGDVNKYFYYPKANVAINLHEFDFWSIDLINQFKLRAAYGQAGKFANFGLKYTSLNNTLIGGQAGSLIDNTLGNPLIEPEKQSEIEFGFDLGFLDNRIKLDLTYYKKDVTDLLLTAALPTSSGFSEKVINGADLENKGLEIGIDALVIDKPDLKWNSTINYWFNRSKVTRLAIPAYNTGAFGATLGSYRIEEGKSVTQIVGIDPSADPTSGIKVFGDAAPDFQLSWSNFITYKNFELSFLFHWKKGYENVNLSTLLFDLNATTHDYDKIDLDPNGALGNGPYRLSQLGVSAAPFVEDASYLRLREVGLFYNIRQESLSNFLNGAFKGIRVGVSAYNLINIFDYNSYDPEVSNFGGGGLSTGVEVTPFPSAKRTFFHLSFKI